MVLRKGPVLAILALLAFGHSPCLAQTSYRLTSVPPLSGTAWVDANMTSHAYLMDLNTTPATIVDLGVLPPTSQSQGYSLNNVSPPQVVGICNYSANPQGFLYHGGFLTSLLPIINCQQIN